MQVYEHADLLDRQRSVQTGERSEVSEYCA